MQLRLAPLVGALTLAALATPLHAQTTANGPYYATPSWDQTMPAASRFVVLANFGNQAVLDRETGLVWQRAVNPGVNYMTASLNCQTSQTGGRFGWRLPTQPELATLLDPTATAGSPLPAGNPFTGFTPGGGVLLSSTVDLFNANSHLDVFYFTTDQLRFSPADSASDSAGGAYLCVRAPGG